MSNSHTTYQFQSNQQEESESAGGASGSSYSSPNAESQDSGSIGASRLSIALIGPDEERRQAVGGALSECGGADVREFSSYPPALDDVPRLLEQYYDVIIIDLDSNPEYALELVENICAKDSATVMVYSTQADRDLVVRCMRAGAREYLTLPFEQSIIAEALVRAAATIHPENRPTKRTRGRMLVFLGAKGGSGVTTIACNFAVAMAQESNQSTLLIDLGLPMGDAALNLGIVAEYSTDNALLDINRLDANFLGKLLVKHRSGVSVLAAPSKVPKVQASNEAIDKLINIARQDFENVIVDVGSRLDLMSTALFKEAHTIYLVTQAGISELRNSNRLISQFFNEGAAKLEIVINRFEPRSLGVTEEHITKALTRPVQWKIPDDYAAARQMQNAAAPVALADTPISRLIRQMARSVCGLPAAPEKKAGFSFRNLSKSIADKMTTTDAPEETTSIAPKVDAAVAWAPPAEITCGTALSGAQLNAEATVPGTFVYTPGAGYVLPAGTHTLWVTFTPVDSEGEPAVQSAVSITVTKATPAINWTAPPTIPCGTALGSAQLNAKASVPGSFVYAPAAGDVLAPGKHTLSVTFTPKDASSYLPAQATVSVNVAKATPAIAWQNPPAITRGTALSAAQLDATSSVPGTFVYTPAVGEVLTAGTHTLSVAFNPADNASYNSSQATVSLTVTKATPTVAWSSPGAITYGTHLNGGQLNASASVPGRFEYIPAEGAMLAAGAHSPSVIFHPEEASDFNIVQAATTLTVTKAAPIISWQGPAQITDSTPLSKAELNAEASVPGTFVYTPAAGEVLSAGAHTLSVAFAPADTTNYVPVQATASINVTRTLPSTISWPTPSDIPYGTALSGTQLNATASVPGTFVYAPGLGDVLAPGKHTLLAIFTPADNAQHATAQATVALMVDSLPNIDSLLNAAAQAPSSPTETAEFNEHVEAQREESQGDGDHSQEGNGPETRTYKGATYVKGEDGKWHLQQS
jgi:Flp pilus assembly CpaE family ATPase